MKDQYILVANWKMNKTIEECGSFVDKFMNLILHKSKSKVIFCPPFSALFYMDELLKDTSFDLGAQNVHWEKEGAFTGEVSAEMLKSTGATYVIVGHSERRQLFGDTDESVNKRMKAALSNGLTPIMCIGETIEERKSGNTLDVIGRQLKNGLDGISNLDIENIIFAYEPVWAIGTGERAEPNMIDEVHNDIRKILNGLGVDGSDEIAILYGGSVNQNNIKDLLELNEVNGFLIGGASLDADEFASIIHQSEQI